MCQYGYTFPNPLRKVYHQSEVQKLSSIFEPPVRRMFLHTAASKNTTWQWRELFFALATYFLAFAALLFVCSTKSNAPNATVHVNSPSEANSQRKNKNWSDRSTDVAFFVISLSKWPTRLKKHHNQPFSIRRKRIWGWLLRCPFVCVRFLRNRVAMADFYCLWQRMVGQTNVTKNPPVAGPTHFDKKILCLSRFCQMKEMSTKIM